jgi:uncharacterized protein (DUF885 family)
VGPSPSQVADDFWQALASREPTYYRHLLGDYSDVGRFEEASRESDARFAETMRSFAQRAEAIDEVALDEQGRITRAAVIFQGSASADLAATPLGDLQADPLSGIQVDLPLRLGLLTVPDETVADQMPDKLDSVGTHLRELAERVREGAADGWVPADYLVRDTIAQLEDALATPLADDPIVAAVSAPEGIDVDGLRCRLRRAVESSVRPGFKAYRDALSDVLAQARPEERCGLSWLEGGEATYAAALRYFTTTDKSAHEVHEIGRAQVEILAEEYRALGPEVMGTDDLAGIFDAMRTDPALHFDHAQELVDHARVALARAEAAMKDWFEVLPEASCAVEGTDIGMIAFYFPPSNDGSRGGTFFVNTSDPSSWGRFELESMAFHEGVPGHHLQLAIAAELPDSVPAFLKFADNSAYCEGWGLYAERLADEMGLYSAAIDRMGMYSSDSMRACRLVVDTGIHAFGWSRQQAIDYMVANSPLTEGLCRREVDRYICYPGQATSYMIGRLELQRMRADAEQRQGERFDVRAFHSAVLDNGALPLDVLGGVVAARLP